MNGIWSDGAPGGRSAMTDEFSGGTEPAAADVTADVTADARVAAAG
jgi:hypothetical protein